MRRELDGWDEMMTFVVGKEVCVLLGEELIMVCVLQTMRIKRTELVSSSQELN